MALDKLSNREIAVIKGLESDVTIEKFSKDLGITIETLRNCLRVIYIKTGLKDRHDLLEKRELLLGDYRCDLKAFKGIYGISRGEMVFKGKNKERIKNENGGF